MASTVVRRRVFALLAVLVISALALALWLWSALVAIAPRSGPADVLALIDGAAPPAGSVAEKIRGGTRVTLLLLARGGSQAEDPNLTDTILVLSAGGARPPVLVSLPRWLSVRIPAPAHGVVMSQLYAAYELGTQRDNPGLSPRFQTATGGGDLAAATVSDLIGWPIDGWMVIDIRAFRAMVDALGGVELTVPTSLDDAQYPIDDSTRTMRIHFNAGRQRMNGEQALQYARSRLSTSEADRARRQQLVLTAIVQRISSMGLGLRTVPLVAALRGGMMTNLRPIDLKELSRLLGGAGLEHSRHVTIDDSDLVRKLPIAPNFYIVLPSDPTYRTLRSYLSDVLAG